MITRNRIETLGSRAFCAWLDKQPENRKQAAARIGVSASTVTRWSKGDAKPSDAKRLELQSLTSGDVPAALWAHPMVPVSP